MGSAGGGTFVSKDKGETEPGVPVERHPRFYDPILVFTEMVPHGASAYPLADPPGIVVDIHGIPEPLGKAAVAVGKDDRVRMVRRRTTKKGTRYIINLTTPIKRIETEYEGRVVLVYPLL
jgi:hypothetical protein